MKKSIIFFFLSSLWLFSQSFSTESQIIPIVDTGDVNNNGIPDFLAFNGESVFRTIYLYEIDDSGPKVLWKYALSPAKVGYFVDAVVGDFNGNNLPEIILISSLENSYDMFYIFELIGDGFGPVPQNIKKYPLNNSSVLRPTKAHNIKWDDDKDDEFLLIFSSPGRSGFICDYENNEILVVESIGKNFLQQTHSPILSSVCDFNNDELEDIVLINNSNSPVGNVYLNGMSESIPLNLPEERINSISVDGVGKMSFVTEENNPYSSYFTDSLFITEPITKACQIDLSGISSILFFAEDVSNIVSLFLEDFEMLIFTHGGNNPEIAFYKIQIDKPLTENQSDLIVNDHPDFILEPEDVLEYQVSKNEFAKFLLFESTTMPNGMKFDTENFKLHWKPNKRQLGLWKVQYKTIYRKPGNLEETINADFQKVELNEEIITKLDSFVVYVNSPPIFDSNITEFSIVSGDTLTYNLKASDANTNSKLNFSFVSNYNQSGEVSEDGYFQFIATDEDVGKINFPLIVTDGFASDTISLLVSVHSKIILDSDSTIFNVNVGEELEIKVVPEIANPTTQFVFKLIDYPENMRINSKGVIQWIPTYTQIDTQRFVVSVADNYAQSSIDMFVYVNAPPIISSRPSKQTIVKTNEEWEFPLGSFDANTNSVLTWKLLDSPNNMIIDSLGVLKYKPNSLGWFEYSIELSDGISTAEFQGEIYVNSPPVILTEPPTLATCGERYSYFMDVSDSNLVNPFAKDSINALFYQLLDAPRGMEINTDGEITWVPADNQFGKSSYSVLVSDKHLFDKQDVNLFVNSLPVLISYDSISVRINQEIVHNILVEDLNLNDTITFSISENTVGLEFDTAQGIIRWVPSREHAGNHNFIINCSDGHQNINVKQILKIFVYDYPQFKNSPNEEAYVGLKYEFIPVILDFLGDSNTSFSIDSSTSSRIALEKSTNSIVWIPDSTDIGLHSFTIKVVDRFGLTSSKSYNVTVSANPCENGEDENVEFDTTNIKTEPTIRDSLILPKEVIDENNSILPSEE